MFNKIIVPGSYRFDAPVAVPVPLSSRGLRGHDLGEFIKRAGYSMADAVRRTKFASGEVPIHLLAIGATEYYGPNRNGDGFDEDVCRIYHPTFVKHARWYRNHQNKDPKRSYGVVKYSFYNEPMHRIELLVALNGSKEAAQRNGGLPADRELEKVSREDPNWGVSMACRVPFDVCSGCGHVARTRDEYCTEETCRYGGLKNNITKVAEDGHFLHAKNTKPDFFDISDVWKPADRIAYVLGVIEKAAAAGGVPLGGAEAAERMGVTAPVDLVAEEQTDPRVRSQLKLAAELASLEPDVSADARGLAKLAGAWGPAVQGPGELPRCSTAELGAAYRAMADQNAMLPVADFLRLTQGMNLAKAAEAARGVRPLLRGAFTRLAAEPERLAADLADGRFVPCDCRPAADLVAWAVKAAAACSLHPGNVQRRAWLAAIRPQEPASPMKNGFDAGTLEKFARDYSLYQLALLDARRDDSGFALTVDTMIRHNHSS